MSLEPQSNPFATRFTAPGRLPWIATAGTDLDDLEQRFIKANMRGAIIGPHGSGKSTLLEHLVPRFGIVSLKRNFEGQELQLVHDRPLTAPDIIESQSLATRKITWLQLRSREPKSMLLPLAQLSVNDLLVLDGYEQLNPVRRAVVVYRTRIREVGLLVTSHRPTLLPTLCKLRVTPEVASHILQTLAREDELQPLLNPTDASELEQRLKVQQGNMRELLMDLYDRFEEQRETLRKMN